MELWTSPAYASSLYFCIRVRRFPWIVCWQVWVGDNGNYWSRIYVFIQQAVNTTVNKIDF